MDGSHAALSCYGPTRRPTSGSAATERSKRRDANLLPDSALLPRLAELVARNPRRQTVRVRGVDRDVAREADQRRIAGEVHVVAVFVGGSMVGLGDEFLDGFSREAGGLALDLLAEGHGEGRHAALGQREVVGAVVEPLVRQAVG